MIDRSLLRQAPELVRRMIERKDPSFPIDRLIELEHEQLQAQQLVDSLRHQKNECAELGKQGVTAQLREKARTLGAQLKEQEIALDRLHNEFMALYLTCPNIPADDLPVGGKGANKVVNEVGVKPQFSFAPKNHLELATNNGWLDFEAAAVMTGSQFPLYRGDGVRLMYALTMYLLKNNIKHGYEPVLPPYLVNEESLVVAGVLPKFKDQVYSIDEGALYLIPTAEVSLANLYRNAIFSADQLPINLTAWTSCFRKEAGGYGAHERGLIRVHQFEKVELFTVCIPERSEYEQEKMVSCATAILKELGLHYRVTLLATEDCSFQSAKTYDIEVWMPGQGIYSEVSSISNCTDFQARRGSIRYRQDGWSKPQLVHTLNGSSLALSRLMVAIIETYQHVDGTIKIPKVLQEQGVF